MGCYSVASVPKSGSVGACSPLPVGKIKKLCVLCFPLCDNLSPRGRRAALSPEHCRPFSRTKAGAQHGTCPPEGVQVNISHIPSKLPMATQGWHPLGHSFGHFLTCSPGAPFSVTVALFPHNHIFSGGNSLTLSSSLSDFPTHMVAAQAGWPHSLGN